MDRVRVRNTAIGAAIACGAMVGGPGVSGTPVANADLFGVGADVLGISGHHRDNKKGSHHRAGANGRPNGGAGTIGRPGQGDHQKTGRSGLTGKQKTSVSGKSTSQKSVGLDEAGARRSVQSANTTSTLSRGEGASDTSAAVPEAQVSGPQIRPSVSSIGGGATMGGRIGRSPSLASVPTAPSSRQIVVRAPLPGTLFAPAEAGPEAGSPVLATPSSPVVASPVPVALPRLSVVVSPVPVVLPPLSVAVPPGTAGGGVPAAAPPTPSAPQVTAPTVQAAQPTTPVISAAPETFRAGYPDYLRVADTPGLLFAVLPGLAGIVLLTATGGALGIRQARAIRGLQPPQIARFLP
ncbi:hypothetical protein [Mycobacterium sp. 141]|uniref:hypothetical protein n=1 Tax=Mycobacterium sp. 141 TaxID=1120797 RepID=UPI001E3860E7|nr:hypothetical protein [Mycobacterium sp. 141]